MAMEPELLLQRLVQRVLTKSAGEEINIQQNGETTEEMIVDAFADRLTQMFIVDKCESSDPKISPRLEYSIDGLFHYEELVERNGALAGALGACDCWGEQDACDVCHGTGKPGWTLPDKQLFSEFIRPAINALRRLNVSIPGSVTQTRKTVKGG